MSIWPDEASRTAKVTLKKSFGKRLLDKFLADEDKRLRLYKAASAWANLADLGVLVCKRVCVAGPSPLVLCPGEIAVLRAVVGGAAELVPADTRERVHMMARLL